MTGKTKKIGMVFGGVLLAACLGAGIALTGAAAEIPFEQERWTEVPSTWTLNDDGTATNRNNDFTANILLGTDDALVGDYSVEATFQGTNTTEVTNEINMGLSPWHLDDRNFVLIYLIWNTTHGFNLCNVQTICYINGQQQGWNDHWLDNEYRDTLYTLKPTDAITVQVEKRLNASATADTYRVTVSGTNSEGHPVSATPATIDFAVSAPYAATKVSAGVYSNHDTVTVRDYKVEPLTESGVYKSVDGTDTTGKSSSSAGWTYRTNTYAVDATGGNAQKNQAILSNVHAAGNYSINYTASLSGSAATKELSVLPLYRDENHFVRFTVQEAQTGATISVDGKADGTAFSETLSPYTQAIEWSHVSVSASKQGSTFELKIDGAVAGTYANGVFLDGAKVGIGCGNASGTFTEVGIESLAYLSYSWYNDNGWYISAKDRESVTIMGTTVQLSSPSGAEEMTRMYTASEKYDRVRLSGSFTADSENAEYGFYLYYADDTHYVLAYVAEGKLTLMSVSGGEPTETSTALPLDFDAKEAHTLSAEAVYHDITLSLDGTQLTATAAIDAETGNVGIAVRGALVTVTEFAIDGFVPYTQRTEGNWRLTGSRLGTWTVGENALTGSVIGGTEFKRTLALTDAAYSPAEGYIVGASVKITELKNTEWKTGILPYYLDGSNYVYVWMSQWSGSATTITITASLNGHVVGNEWRETPVAYTLLNAVNYLEVEIRGDGVFVYLNKSFSPTVSVSIDGLGSAQKGSYGFNISNTSAEFKEISIGQDRLFVEAVPPTIDVIGTLPSSGTVGAEITLPIFSASGNGGTTANVTVTVFAPDASYVSLNHNSFTPTVAGTYTVTVTATDSWGNTATKTYTISVSEKSNDESGEEEKKKGCGSEISGIAILFGSLVIVGAIMFVRKSVKKNGT